MYTFGQFCHYEKLQAIFWHVLWELRGFRGGVLLLCKSSLVQSEDSRGDLQGPPSENQKEWTLTWDEDLLSLPPVLSLS